MLLFTKPFTHQTSQTCCITLTSKDESRNVCVDMYFCYLKFECHLLVFLRRTYGGLDVNEIPAGHVLFPAFRQILSNLQHQVINKLTHLNSRHPLLNITRRWECTRLNRSPLAKRLLTVDASVCAAEGNCHPKSPRTLCHRDLSTRILLCRILSPLVPVKVRKEYASS